MFGNNEIVGQKYFVEDQTEELVSITSIFATLQGEGPFSGRRAVFVRLAKCNLNCHFCDTYFDSGNKMTIAEVKNRVFAEFSKFLTPEQKDNLVPCEAPMLRVFGEDPIIVFTGGEPSLQMDMLEKLVRAFDYYEFHCQIESNGIIPFTDYIWDKATVVISPKCAEKNGIPTKYIKPHKDNLERTKNLKFVVTSDITSPYSTIPEWARLEFIRRVESAGIKLRRSLQMFISPMNIYNRSPVKAGTTADLETRSVVDETISFWEEGLLNMEENRKNHEWAAQLCMTTGATLCLQTHLYASLP